MLYTIIKENMYQDSIALMLLSNKLSAMDNVNQVSIMMGTPANKDIFKSSGLETPELEYAGPNDIVIVIDTENESAVSEIKEKAESELKKKSVSQNGPADQEAHNWKRAVEMAGNPNLALISIPGQYAAMEADNALNHGMHVFIFSNNMPKEDEIKLKRKAREKGLLVMGPDCGTGIINGVPLAFTNSVREGDIGVVGASGTGIQEVTTIIDRFRKGVSNAFGTGGRDLSSEVGAVTMIDSIKALNENPDVKVITVISKPPAKEVKEKVLNLLRNVEKPVVTLFLGERPSYHEPNIYHAYTLHEAASAAVQLADGREPVFVPETVQGVDVSFEENQHGIKGYYSGGTLASEAAMLIQEAFHEEIIEDSHSAAVLKTRNHEIIDLGDDIYTQGKPHPMIDPEKRIEILESSINDPSTAVIMIDVVIGYGSHDNMAGALQPAIKKVFESEERNIKILATVVGTENDPQNYRKQIETLREIGVIVCDTNDQMVRTAIELTGGEITNPNPEIKTIEHTKEDLSIDESILSLMYMKPSVINIGLKSFSETIKNNGADCVQFNWRPVAGGDEKLMKILQFLNNYEEENFNEL
ncbi:acyl-CoA synthetase FdrA [Corticicoccus populi]|uniref:Acyl-CoA synthetase FdrA n=1 Tax=Corticicoccus populi TaxID=1812821 RepID=A0ABW5WWA8_9STAP